MAHPIEAEQDEPELSIESDWNFQYIGGEWHKRGSRGTISVENPSTRNTWAEVPAGTPQDVDAAFNAASDAEQYWGEESPETRISLLQSVQKLVEEFEDDLIELLVTESGSTKIKSDLELQTTIADVVEATTYPAREQGDLRDSRIGGKENLVKREPVGVVAAISPWNFPLHLSMRVVAPAIALGNSVVIKPAPETPVTGGLAIAKLFEMAGAPSGLINVVTGQDSEIGDQVSGNPEADVVSFTGSTQVGRHVAKQAVDSLAMPTLELGGNSPNIVLDDANLEDALPGSAFGSFAHQGQVCISINRHLVHEDIYDEFVKGMVEKAEILPTGSAHERSTIVGPVINKSQRDKIIKFIKRTLDQGATLETGGGHDGLVVEPTVLSNVENNMTAACNEHFGPVAPIIPISDDEEAIKLANDTEYGLAASVWSGDRNRAEAIADEINAGMVHINDQPINEEPHVPFGGMKASGFGRFHGDSFLHELTEEKWISVQREPRPFPL